MQSKMVVALKAHFVDDTTTNSNSLSNAWNHMFMEVSWMVSFWIGSMYNQFCFGFFSHMIIELYLGVFKAWLLWSWCCSINYEWFRCYILVYDFGKLSGNKFPNSKDLLPQCRQKQLYICSSWLPCKR